MFLKNFKSSIIPLIFTFITYYFAKKKKDPIFFSSLSMGFPRQEYWNGLLGLPFPSPGDLPNPGIEPASPALQADSLPLSHQGSPRAGEDPENQLETNTQELRKISVRLV